MDIAERTMPYNLEAEQAVLGSILIDPECISVCAEKIKSSDFFFEHNRYIYEAVIDMFNLNEPIDVVTVSERLNKEEKLDAVGGIEYLSMLTSIVPTTTNVGEYVHIVEERSLLRKIIRATEGVTNLAYSATDDAYDILEQAEKAIFDINRENQSMVHIKDVLFESYQQMIEFSTIKKGVTGTPTGFSELDKKTSGFQSSNLILLAARPGMGKTSFALNIAENVALREKLPVAIFSLEMSKHELANRIICSEAMVDSNKIRSGELSREDWIKISGVIDKIATAPIFLDDTAAITVSEIRAKCRRIKQRYGLGMIMIDYLQLMQSGSRRSENRQQEVSDISRSLKILAKELEVPVVTLSQLSRASEARTDKHPMLSDLRESGAIEQDADIVMFLYREDYYNPDTDRKGIVECDIAKHRSGETGKLEFGWIGKYTKFTNLDTARKE